LPLVFILRQMNPVHTLPSCFSILSATCRSPKWSLSFMLFEKKNCSNFLSLLCVLHTTPISFFIWSHWVCVL
jgi:hypothetical protein